MKNNFRQFSIVLTALLIGAVIIYFNFYKISYKEMIPAESDMIIYLEKDKDMSKEVEGLLEYFSNDDYKKMWENYIFIRSNTNRAVVVGLATYGIDYRALDEQEIVAFFDFGKKYPFARLRALKYFDKEDGIYMLKDEYKKQLVDKNIIKNEGTVYLKFYRGYAVFSLNKKSMERYFEELAKGDKNEKFIENIDGKSMYMLDFDKFFREPLVIGGNAIDSMRGTLDMKGKNIGIYNVLNFKEDELSTFFSPEDDKILDKYIKKDKGLYINSKSLSDTIFFITVYLSSIYDVGLDFKGLDWSKLLEKIGNEVYIDIEDRSGVLVLKDPNFFKFMFELLLEKGDKGEYIVNDDFVFYLQDNLLFVNEVLPENFGSEIGEEDLLSLYVDFKSLGIIQEEKCDCGAKLRLLIKNTKNKLEMDIILEDILNEKFKENFINKIEKNDVLEEVE